MPVGMVPAAVHHPSMALLLTRRLALLTSPWPHPPIHHCPWPLAPKASLQRQSAVSCTVLWTGMAWLACRRHGSDAAFEGDAVLLPSSVAVRTLRAHVRMSVAFQAMAMT